MLKAALILAALSAATAKAQGAWVDLFPQRADTLWKDTAGPDAPRGGYRLARSGAYPFTLFLANGKKLLQYGETTGWTAFAPGSSGQPFPFQEPAPLAVSGHPQDSLVLWGNWRSRNLGRRWEALPFPSSRFLVYAIGRGGLCLGGGPGETLERSLDSGRTWRTVHTGSASGYVRHLIVGDSGWAFAALHPERILVSRDGGQNWSPWPSSPAPGGTPRRIRAMTLTGTPQAADGYVLWTLHQDSASGKSILVRNLGKAGRSDTVTDLPGDLDATCLSSDASTVLVGGGSRVYQRQGGGADWRMLAVSWPGSAGDLIELHGGGMEFATFALTGKSVYMRYYETGIRAAGPVPASKRQSRPSSRALFAPGLSSASFLADGRRLP